MNEIRRILNKKFIILIFTIQILNIILIVNNNRSNAEKMQFYNELIERSVCCKTNNITYKQAVMIAWKEYVSCNDIDGTKITDDMKEARTMILDNAEYIDGYDTLIQNKISIASKSIDAGIFQGSFEELNLLKSKYDLNKVKDAEVQLDNGIWLEKLYEYDYIQIFVIVLLLVTIYSFFAERTTGLYYLIHSVAEGRGILFRKRTIIIVVEAIVSSVLLYLESSVILIKIYGGIESINALALNDKAFLLVSYNLTRIQFVIVMALISAVCATALALGFWLFLLLFSNINIGLFAYIFFCIIEFIIHSFVTSKATLRFLRYINLYYLINPQKALEYNNWGYSFGIMSICESTVWLSLVLGIIAFLLLMYINVKCYYSGRYNIIEIFIGSILNCIMKVIGMAPMCIKEAYKILISQRCAVILAILLVCVIKMDIGVGTIYNSYMGTMLAYYEQAEGLQYGNELESIYDQHKKEYEEFLSIVDFDNLSDEQVVLFRTELINDIRKNVDYVKKQKEAGVNAVVINPYEYKDAFGKKQEEYQKMMALINILATIVISAGYMSYEKKSGMKRIGRSCGERRKWTIIKMLGNVSLIALFEMLTYGIYYYKLTRIYAFDNINVPIKSLEMFENYPFNPSILGFIIIDLLIKLLCLTAISIVVSVVSGKTSYIYCVLASMVITFPQWLYMLGFASMDKFSIGKYVAFLPVYNLGGHDLAAYYIFLVIIILFGNYLLNRILKREIY